MISLPISALSSQAMSKRDDELMMVAHGVGGMWLTAPGVRLHARAALPDWADVQVREDVFARRIRVRLTGPWWRRRLVGARGLAAIETGVWGALRPAVPDEVGVDVSWA